MSDARYRRKVRVGEIAEALRSLHYEKVLEIMPDHVHLFIQSDPSQAPQPLANPFKGDTSRRLCLKYPQLRSRLASLWSRSYSVGTISHVSEESVKLYIEMQKAS